MRYALAFLILFQVWAYLTGEAILTLTFTFAFLAIRKIIRVTSVNAKL